MTVIAGCSSPGPDVEMAVRYSSGGAVTEVVVTSDESRCRDFGTQRMLSTDDRLVALVEPADGSTHTLFVRLDDGLAFSTREPFEVTASGFSVDGARGSVTRTDGTSMTTAVSGAVVSGTFRCP